MQAFHVWTRCMQQQTIFGRLLRWYTHPNYHEGNAQQKDADAEQQWWYIANDGGGREKKWREEEEAKKGQVEVKEVANSDPKKKEEKLRWQQCHPESKSEEGGEKKT